MGMSVPDGARPDAWMQQIIHVCDCVFPKSTCCTKLHCYLHCQLGYGRHRAPTRQQLLLWGLLLGLLLRLPDLLLLLLLEFLQESAGAACFRGACAKHGGVRQAYAWLTGAEYLCS